MQLHVYHHDHLTKHLLEKIMALLDQLTADVQANKDATASAVTLLNNIVAQLKALQQTSTVDPAALKALTDQLEQNFSVMASSFTEADQSLLDTFLRELAPVYCRMCGSCRGLCPRGLPVANLLRYLTYAEGYGQFDLGREKFLALPKQLRNVRCGDCLNCTIQCPNGVQISRRLSHAQHVFA